MIEHVAAGEEQHGNQTERRPQVAVLKERNHVWPGYKESREGSQHSSGDRNHLDPVDGAGHGWLGKAIGDLARDPGMDLFGSLWAAGEVEADGLSVGLCVGASGRVEVEQHRSGLKHQLHMPRQRPLRKSQLSMCVGIGSISYRLEYVSSVGKVQCTEYQSRLSVVVALHPAVAQQIPLGLEVAAERTSKAGFQCREQDGDGVVARGLCELCVAGIVELERAARGKRLCASVIEAVARGFLGCQSCKRQQRGSEDLEPPHCVVWRAAKGRRGRGGRIGIGGGGGEMGGRNAWERGLDSSSEVAGVRNAARARNRGVLRDMVTWRPNIRLPNCKPHSTDLETGPGWKTVARCPEPMAACAVEFLRIL